ncbi:hypothetical protein EA58_14740 [Photobacterium galatheae]|uniref:Uncharacterized protein n=2 Tax=Photobacterium galatheae TaxID=1654360 RepID=A0A066RKM7_9GAMM|nr:hypothetical protein EA58_14740 [Photobacterium galatheae]
MTHANMNFMTMLKFGSFYYTLVLIAAAVYRATFMAHVATYQDLMFYLSLMFWLCVVLTVKENERTHTLSAKCITSSLIFMLLSEQTSESGIYSGWNNKIDEVVDAVLGGMELTINFGKPEDLIPYISTLEIYHALYNAQAGVLMLLLLIGTLKSKGVKKFAPKKSKRVKSKIKS